MGIYPKIKKYVEKWKARGYADDIPDLVPNEINHIAPSYKAIAIALLKNDISLKSLGVNRGKSEWYGAFKKIELDERKKKNIHMTGELK